MNHLLPSLPPDSALNHTVKNLWLLFHCVWQLFPLDHELLPFADSMVGHASELEQWCDLPTALRCEAPALRGVPSPLLVKSAPLSSCSSHSKQQPTRVPTIISAPQSWAEHCLVSWMPPCLLQGCQLAAEISLFYNNPVLNILKEWKADRFSYP